MPLANYHYDEHDNYWNRHQSSPRPQPAQALHCRQLSRQGQGSGDGRLLFRIDHCKIN